MSNLELVQAQKYPSPKESAPKRINTWTLKYNFSDFFPSSSISDE